MKPLPENLMERHAVFIEALCADWREAGTATRVTPRADRVMEISRQMDKQSKRSAGSAEQAPASDR